MAIPRGSHWNVTGLLGESDATLLFQNALYSKGRTTNVYNSLFSFDLTSVGL